MCGGPDLWGAQLRAASPQSRAVRCQHRALGISAPTPANSCLKLSKNTRVEGAWVGKGYLAEGKTRSWSQNSNKNKITHTHTHTHTQAHTQDSLWFLLKLPESFTLELRARGFSEKTNRTHNRPYCSLEGAYLRQKKRPPIIPVRDHCPPGCHSALWGCGKRMTSEALQRVSLRKKRDTRGLGEGGRLPESRAPRPSHPPMTALQAQQEWGSWAPGASIQPVTGLGSHSPGAKRLSGRPAARPGQAGL